MNKWCLTSFKIKGDNTNEETNELVMETFKKKGDYEATKKRKELLERIIDNAPSMIIGVNLQNNVMIFNKEAERITGYSKDDALGSNFYSLLLPEWQRDNITEKFDEVKHCGSIYNIETCIITKNGDERLISWCGGEMINVQDRMIGEIYVGTDITDRKEQPSNEESVNLAQEHTEEIPTTSDQVGDSAEFTGYSAEDTSLNIDWKVAFNSIADPITIIGREKVILWVNSAFASKLKAESEELIGKSVAMSSMIPTALFMAVSARKFLRQEKRILKKFTMKIQI